MKAMIKVVLVALLGCAASVNALVETLVHEDFADFAHVDPALHLGVDDLPLFKLDELAAHNLKADCWVAYAGGVYDASGLLGAHCPVDDAKLAGFCGHDVTDFLRGPHKKHFDGHLFVNGRLVCPAFAFHNLFRKVGLLDVAEAL